MTDSPQKILIRGVNWIGDAVLTTPALQALRNAFPHASVTLLVKPWVADIFRGNPSIDETILYDDQFSGLRGKIRLAKTLQRERFQSAILLQNAFEAALIAWLARIPERIGYSRDLRRPLLTRAVPVGQDILRRHQVYYYTNLLEKALNIEMKNPEPSIFLHEDEIREARALIKETLDPSSGAPLIGINPGATYGSAKRWFPERFAEVMNRLVNTVSAKIILFGGTSEQDIAAEILSHVQAPHGHVLNRTGETTLRQLAALINECDVFITNDSGPMHMAAALLVPVIAVFGSTDSATTGPFGEGHRVIRKDISCSPCLERECPEGHLKCMEEISANDVFQAVEHTLPAEKAVFLDRDGTLNEDRGYLNSFSDLKLFPGVKEELERLKEAGFHLIGITNQSGIARGLIEEDFVRECNAHLEKILGMDDFYYCPHLPDAGCQCRKPGTYLIRKARLKHRINLKASYVIGDKTIDVILARAVGARGILVQTGHDRESPDADFTARDLKDGVDWILRQEKDA